MSKLRIFTLKALFIFSLILLCFLVILVGLSQFRASNKYKNVIFKYADYYNLDRNLVFSIIKAESNFNPRAVSEKGAYGLMQITQPTFDYVCYLIQEENLDIFSPQDNIRVGCYYLSYLLFKFNDINTALCAYNAGEGNVRKWLEDKSL